MRIVAGIIGIPDGGLGELFRFPQHSESQRSLVPFLLQMETS